METRLTEEHIVVLAKTLIDLTIDGQFPKHLTPDLVYTVVKEAMAVIGTGIFTYEPLARWFPAHRESITEWDKRGYNRG